MSSVSELVENYHHGNDLSDTSTLTSAVILERSGRGGFWVMGGWVGAVSQTASFSTAGATNTQARKRACDCNYANSSHVYSAHIQKHTYRLCKANSTGALGPAGKTYRTKNVENISFGLPTTYVCVCFQMFQYHNIKLGPLVQTTSQAGLSELIYKRTFIH